MEPVMPHLLFSGDELEGLYPRLVAPEDDHLDDPTTDGLDLTLWVGQQIAEGVRSRMHAAGWRRRNLQQETASTLLCWRLVALRAGRVD